MLNQELANNTWAKLVMWAFHKNKTQWEHKKVLWIMILKSTKSWEDKYSIHKNKDTFDFVDAVSRRKIYFSSKTNFKLESSVSHFPIMKLGS